MTRITYREAMREAIRGAMQRDPRVFLMGEDVGRYGGSFAVSKDCSPSSVKSAFATRRCRSLRSSVPGSALRSAACGRSSRS